MGVFDFVKNGVKEMMIARPDTAKQLLCYKHPDQNFPMYSQLTVDSDECAVFFKDGRVIGVLPPGRHTLQTQNIPFLNNIVNNFTGGNVFICEIFFVRTTPKRGIPFGGPLELMEDPFTNELVTPRIFGEFAIVVVDPVKFVIGYHGQGVQNDEDNERWIKDLFRSGVKNVLGAVCGNEGKSLLQANAIRAQLAQAFVQNAPDLAEMGLRVHAMGDFQITFTPDDERKLKAVQGEIAAAKRDVKKAQIAISAAEAAAKAKQFELDQKFQQDARYVQQLAGNYQNYAAGQAMMGAGQGMAQHGVGEGGIAGMAAQAMVGVNMAGGMMQGGQWGQQPQSNIQQAPGAQVTCSKCATRQPAGKFCAECGTGLVQAKKFCANCGNEVGATSKFCAGCGTPQVAVASPTTTTG